jgi:hypothetical protein
MAELLELAGTGAPDTVSESEGMGRQRSERGFLRGLRHRGEAAMDAFLELVGGSVHARMERGVA